MFLSSSKKYPLFRIFGFQVVAESSALILLVIYLLMSAGSGAAGTIATLFVVAVVFVSILLHELGHAFAVRRLGLGESLIILHGLGGLCVWRGQATPRARIKVALAGPAASLAIGVVALLGVVVFGTPTSYFPRVILNAFLWVNLGWSVFNLLPIHPLDGGQALRTWLSMRKGQAAATALSLHISMATAGAVILLSLLVLNQIFLALLSGFILFNNYQELQRTQPRPPPSYGPY